MNNKIELGHLYTVLKMASDEFSNHGSPKSMLTPTQRRALEILRDHAPLSPSVFAKWMWPDAEAWSHHTKCGHGTSHGGGMNLAGGAYLGKLRKRGWAERWYGGFVSKPPGWYLSDEGKAALDTDAPTATGVALALGRG